MCGDVTLLDDSPPPVIARPISRRGFLGSLAAVTAGMFLPAFDPSRAAASAIDSNNAYSMAMHIHSSFSEQSGSVESQLNQAQRNAVDVVWFTDHDHRMSEFAFRKVVHFTSLTGEKTDGAAWQWQQKTTGNLVSGAGGIDTQSSPNDPVVGSSLAVSAKSAGGLASFGFSPQTHSAGWNDRCNAYGQTWTFDVLPTSIGPAAYLELLISSSYHLAQSGRPAGVYQLSYRIGGSGVPGSRVANGNQGVVTLPAVAGQWNSMAITPADDIAAIWPDLMSTRDFATDGITLSAVSTGDLASGNFDFLQFVRNYTTGQVPVQTHADVIASYSAAFGAVSRYQALEISRFLPHVNWFGGQVQLGDYAGVTTKTYSNYVRQQVAAIHAAGGAASFNHPLGYSEGNILSQTAQDSAVSSVAASLLGNNALDCDILEVGYVNRGGCDLAHHAALWDVMSRNARFLTGNGVSDDHFDQNWLGLKNNWITAAWAPSAGALDLADAMRKGRAWTASLSRFRGTVDMVVDGSCPMGSVSMSQVPQRQLQVVTTGVPVGGRVEVVQGVCDYMGTVASSSVMATVPAGSGSVAVDNGVSSFVRSQVKDSTGAVVALSNPVWLLREQPPTAIPTARAC